MSTRTVMPTAGDTASDAASDAAGGTAAAEWDVWTTTARVVVTDPRVIEDATILVRQRLADVDRAASRFRHDSEISVMARSDQASHVVSPLLANLIRAGLDSASRTGGAVDPTLGRVLTHLGYGADGPGSTAAQAAPAVIRWTAHRRATWRDVTVSRDTVRLPVGTLLDLGASAKAWTADHCAEEIAARFGCGAMVSLGGDLRVAGAEPPGGWNVLVQDGEAEPASYIRLSGADAVATSSTLHRRWRRNGQAMHHVVDPKTALPAPPVWRTVTVAAATCLTANTLTTQAIVLGAVAPRILGDAGVAARLVDASGAVLLIGGWPA